MLFAASLLLLACTPAPPAPVPTADTPSPEEAQAPTGEVPESPTTIPPSAEPTEPAAEATQDVTTEDNSQTSKDDKPEAELPPAARSRYLLFHHLIWTVSAISHRWVISAHPVTLSLPTIFTYISSDQREPTGQISPLSIPLRT